MFSYCERSVMRPALARHYFRQMVSAIAFMHKNHGAHRDLKPDNLLLSRLLELKIGDFGFVRRVADPAAGEFNTHLVGTPFYNPPEMQGPAEGSNPDPKAQDVFMMGCCLFVMLTNTFPFEANDKRPRRDVMGLLDAVQSEDAPRHDRTAQCRLAALSPARVCADDSPAASTDVACAGYWKSSNLLLQGRKVPNEIQRKFFSPACLDLLNRMWNASVTHRITAESILEHPWCTHDDNGNPYVDYDMRGAVLDVARGGEPLPDSLLDQMCRTQRPGMVVSMLREINRPHIEHGCDH